MTNDRNSQPLMTASNMAPGQSASGFVVIGNAGTVRFDYSLRSDGTASKLWNALQLTVVDVASGRVIVDHAPLTSTPTAIGSLAPGATQKLLVRLELPSWYGNDYQGQSARIDFVWHATG